MKEQNTSIRAGKLELSLGVNVTTQLLFGSIVFLLISLVFLLLKFFIPGYILFGMGILIGLAWLVCNIYWQTKDPSKLRGSDFELNKLRIEKKK